MKRFIIYFVFIFTLNACFGQTYNYYHRNEITGTFMIKNIENIPEQYHFIFSKQDNQIVGYYYNSSKVKFIDTINGSRITKSTYYSKETGKVLYEKEFFYDDDLTIKSFIYKQMNNKGTVIYESKSFFKKQSNRIIYNSEGVIYNDNVEQRFIIDGVLFENYQPVSYKTYGLLIELKNKISQFFNAEETFIYDDCNITSIIFQNSKIYKLKRKHMEGCIKKSEEILFNTNEEQVSSKQYILDDSILTQIIKTNSESVNQYHYVRIDESCYLLNYNDWDNTPVVKIEIPDEIVYIKNNVVENIKFPIDLFDFSIFQE